MCESSSVAGRPFNLGILFLNKKFLIIIHSDARRFFYFFCQELVNGEIAARPRWVIVLVEQDDPAWRHPGIKITQRLFVGIVNVAVEMDKTEASRGQRFKSISEISGDQRDSIE